ncbi:MAG TPA: hypothetical protein VG294_19705 [Solirubrobacteraceae bacterium]|jgi:hypothetical protein|nr:hypothetical protein [Solirubrobacteraceae bacterium]
MSDLRADQRAKDLLAADPGVINELVAMFRTVAAQAQTTADGLRGAAGDATWVGNAADAFRHGVGRLPDDLGKVTSSYQEAADALGAFEGEVSSLKPAFQSILSQLQSAQSQLATAQNQLAGAQSALNTAQAQATAKSFTSPLSPLVIVPTSSPLHTAVNAASGAISNAQGEIDALTSRGFQLLAEFASGRGHAQGRVSAASSVPPHRGFWDNLWHGVSNFFIGIGKFIIKPVLDLPHAIADFAEHPSLETFGKLAEDVAGTALLAATVLAPFAAPELAAADAAEATAAAGTVTEGGVTLQKVVNGATWLAGNGGKVAAGSNAAIDLQHGNYEAATVDTTFGAVPDASNVLGIGDRAVAQAEGTVKAWGQLQDAVHELPLPSDIQSALSAAAADGQQSAGQVARQAQWTYDRSGHLVDYGAEQTKRTAQKPADKLVGAPHE